MRAIWTVGHSTLSIDDFIARLGAHDIELVADVRRYPGSRRVPHFASEPLATGLGEAGVAYQWLGDSLGGRRRASPDSPNVGWKHESFRGYADYLETVEFAEGLFDLQMLSAGLRTAVMCAEVLWWRCHRRLISDVLTTMGFRVVHIRGDGGTEVHELRPPARIVSGRLRYTQG